MRSPDLREREVADIIRSILFARTYQREGPLLISGVVLGKTPSGSSIAIAVMKLGKG